MGLMENMVKIRDSLIETEIKKRKSDNRFNIIVASIVAILLFICYLNVFVFMNVMVSGPSMERTLSDGDGVIADKSVKAVEPGDIIIIEGVKSDLLIKRVIAVDKCTVEIRPDGYVYVDGVKIEEPYLNGMLTTPHAYSLPEYARWDLQEGDIFYLGDNRWVSADSREYGTCTMDNVAGVVMKWSILIKDDFGRMMGSLSSAG